MTDRIGRAALLYERAVFGGDAAALDEAERDLAGVEADLALARGRILHARYLDMRVEDPQELPLFERAVELYRQLGDARGEGESLFWVGTVHQVVRQDNATAAPAFARARELATLAGDRLTLSYVLRHLTFAAQAAGRLDAARELLTESTRLRRELGFVPGVAANLIGLAYLAAGDGRPDEARGLLDEAAALAATSDAHGVARWIGEARDGLGLGASVVAPGAVDAPEADESRSHRPDDEPAGRKGAGAGEQDADTPS
ncbi:tetratricopeptide repeat protein [Micromonospora phytophila]|uniref:tetratricopeptide repeat protein n=1 Tax=Micromonospora phytophila TaxID=709888 RepID=UPI00202E76B4|nr:tetratricopeptide repeat protein [Micromonospora phytophila]MCM0676255.1 tetratricopeptide repeat protein [Micromonospora phytophila]